MTLLVCLIIRESVKSRIRGITRIPVQFSAVAPGILLRLSEIFYAHLWLLIMLAAAEGVCAGSTRIVASGESLGHGCLMATSTSLVAGDSVGKTSTWTATMAHSLHAIAVFGAAVVASVALASVRLTGAIMLASASAIVRSSLPLSAQPKSRRAVRVGVAVELVAGVIVG